MSTLDEITKEKQRIAEALARAEAQREKLTGQLGELEAAERLMAGVQCDLPAGRSRARRCGTCRCQRQGSGLEVDPRLDRSRIKTRRSSDKRSLRREGHRRADQMRQGVRDRSEAAEAKTRSTTSRAPRRGITQPSPFRPLTGHWSGRGAAAVTGCGRISLALPAPLTTRSTAGCRNGSRPAARRQSNTGISAPYRAAISLGWAST